VSASLITAEDVLGLVKSFNPDFYRVAMASSEDEFCGAVARAVRNCLQTLEDGRKLWTEADERQLSKYLADLLTRGGLPTTAETFVNGHVDIVVNHFERGRYRMLGECKIDRGPKHHCDGTKQLMGYCGGSEKSALSIGFCHMPDVTARMRDVRAHFDETDECHSVVETRDNELPWSFIGVHRHPSGTTVEIVHISGNLHEAT
jgi:hypothetical protein